MTEIERLVQELTQRGHEVERIDDGALYSGQTAQLALFAEGDSAGKGVVIRAHLDLDVVVDEDALPEVLLGVNLLNQNLDFGSIVLDPLEIEEDERILFAVLGRSVLLLSDLSAAEVSRLEEHLVRFETEVSDAVERSLSGPEHLKA